MEPASNSSGNDTGYTQIPTDLGVSNFDFARAFAAQDNFHTNANGDLAQATFEKLIAVLTHDKNIDEKKYFIGFLGTYRCFTNPYTLHASFELCFKQAFDYEDKLLSTYVQERIVRFYNCWLQRFWSDVRIECPELGNRIQDFLSFMERKNPQLSSLLAPAANRISDIINNVTSSLIEWGEVEFKPKAPKVPKGSDWTVDKMDPAELAKQFALFTHRRYLALSLGELSLPPKWQVDHKRHLTPRIMELIGVYEKIRQFAIGFILVAKNATTKVKHLELLVSVAQRLVELRCFDSSGCIIAGMNQYSVIRLHDTFEALSKSTKAKLDQLRALFSANRAHAALKQAEYAGPCLPSLHTFLTDLIFINEHKNMVGPSNCNITKMLLCGQVLQQFDATFLPMSVPYGLVPTFDKFMLNVPLLDDDLIHDIAVYLGSRSSEASDSVNAVKGLDRLIEFFLCPVPSWER